MTRSAVVVENLGKCYQLGETHESTLSDYLMRGIRALSMRPSKQDPAGRQEFWALRDLSLEIGEGEAVGIVGGNGAGKSTFLKVLSRITPPTTGRALVRGRLSSLLEVGTGFHPELTGRENVYLNGAILGMRKAEVAAKFDEIVAFAGVEQFIDTPVKRYSSGMYVRLAFAVAAHLEPEVLIIDEVLAVGDADFQKRCLGKMGEVARQGRTVIFVSHNMAAVQRLCSRVIWLAGGRLMDSGDPGSIIGRYIGASSPSPSSGQQDSIGCIYRDDSLLSEGETAKVVRVEMVDESGCPISEVPTWGAVVFQIDFEVSAEFRSFSVVLQVLTADGVSILLTSTSPDRSRPFRVSKGRYRVHCAFSRFPLAAGDYVLGLGLAIPKVEYVWRNESASRIHVRASDVFESGHPPTSARYLVATPHEWSELRSLT